jgi:hypothetical protein
MIVLKIENAIALREIEAAAVQLAAMRQSLCKRVLRQFGIRNLGFDIVDNFAL